MKMLESIGMRPRGKHAVVIGRSNIVGKPMALLLLQARHGHHLPQRPRPTSGRDDPAGRHRGGGRGPAATC
jgi:hypothetical protein